MGTRADFYIKEGEEMKWLGSTCWDGYAVANQKNLDCFSPNNMQNRTDSYLEYLIHNVSDGEEYTELVKEYLNKRRDGRHPKDGWPWPWKNSKLTDEVYVFDVSLGHLLRMVDDYRDYDNHLTACAWCHVGDAPFDEEGEIKEVLKTWKFTVPDMSHLEYDGKGAGFLHISL